MKSDYKIAVIGMACRFPGAGNLDEYWNVLTEGRETIKHFTDEDLSGTEYEFEKLREKPEFVKARGVLAGIDMFDADFFSISPMEAAMMDPQQRIWLETAWEALEDAGCDPFTYTGSIGVYAGGAINTYLLNNILRDPVRLENYIRLRTAESYQIMTGNDAAFIPTKTAYKFNLRGPAINVQTACSTSLVAIAQACQSLFSYESDVCIAGGICITVPQETGYLFQEGAIPSPDGKCRPFDAAGKGTVFSNGVGIVVLKRMEDAIQNKDRIYAGVRGWALNNDGNNKVSYTAPSVDGQANVIRMAQSFAEITPEQVGYIEAHGTATQLGDPIELTALAKAFSGKTDKRQYCGIGSVKSNIGHTDAAAGVASFIKSCMAVYKKIIPATLNYSKPNPHFDFINSPFFVQDKLRKWDKPDPLIIGISSFGIGGTNAHVIVEEPPAPEHHDIPGNTWPALVVLSARSDEALSRRKTDLAAFIRSHEEIMLKDIAFTLQCGRNHMSYRSFCIAENIKELISESGFSINTRADEKLKGVAFMFSGQGAQYSGMGKQLYETNIKYRQILDSCFEIFRFETGSDLKKILFDTGSNLAQRTLSMTAYTQPALFVTEYALARVYEDLGVKPTYLIGHSIGEYAAACLSGVFDLETAMRIVIKRGELMQKMPEGSMMAARCSRQRLEELASPLFEIAADNSAGQCTISFKTQDGDKVKAILDRHEIKAIPLNTSHAFHSSSFDPILYKFADYVCQFRLKKPEIPFISCLTGDFITPEQAVSGKYWAQQLRGMVRFREGISAIAGLDNVLFLEIGPDTHLTGIARNNDTVRLKNRVIPSLGKPGNDERQSIMVSLGNLWASGIDPNFRQMYLQSEAIKIELPAYPFQRKRYWIEYNNGSTPGPKMQAAIMNVDTGLTERKSDQVNGSAAALKALLAETSGYPAETIKDEISFSEMGFDSLFLTQYAHNIEKKLKVKVEFRQLISEHHTIRKLSSFIDNKTFVSNPDNKENKRKCEINNFVRFQPEGSREPLIFLHGQDADSFLPAFLGPRQPYFGFLHPGSDGEDLPWKDVREMADSYLKQLLIHKPGGPYLLGGFSFGGILAFEMAIMLKKMGHDVPFVILFDSFAQPEPFRWHNSFFKIVKSNLLVPPVMEALRLFKITVCKTYIILQRPTPIKYRNFYIVDRYFKMMKRYKPGKFDGKVILFRAVENESSLKNLGWENHAEEIRVIPLKAGHISLLKNEESIRTIQTEIQKLLETVQILN